MGQMEPSNMRSLESSPKNLFEYKWKGHNILELTTGVTLFKNSFKSDPTKLFPSTVLVTTG
jgi:hypothetical protein